MPRSAEKELKDIRKTLSNLRQVHKKIEEVYGKKCPDFEETCIVCQMHQSIDFIYSKFKEDEEEFLEELQ